MWFNIGAAKGRVGVGEKTRYISHIHNDFAFYIALLAHSNSKIMGNKNDYADLSELEKTLAHNMEWHVLVGKYRQ